MEYETPFPTIGEVVRFLVEAFGLNEGVFYEEHKNAGETEKERKKFRRKLNRFAMEKDFDMEKANYFIEETFGKFFKVITKEFFGDIEILRNYIINFLYTYRDMVLQVDTKGNDRTGMALYVINFIYNYFGTFHIVHRDPSICKLYISPEDEFWYLYDFEGGKAVSPIEKIVGWWEKLVDVKDHKALASLMCQSPPAGDLWDGSEELHSHYTRLMRWLKGESLPKANTILYLFQNAPAFTMLKNKEKVSLCILLLAARGMQYLLNLSTDIKENKDIEKIKGFQDGLKEMISKKKSIMKKADVGIEKILPFLMNYWNDPELAAQLPFKISDEEKELTQFLYPVMNLDIPTTVDEYYIIKSIVESFEEKVPSPGFSWFFLWCQARFYTCSGDFEKGALKYNEAFEAGKYKAGEHLKTIIQEGYTLAAYCEHKDILKNMHKWGMAYKLFEEKFEYVKDWICVIQKQQFFNIFPRHYFYTPLMKPVPLKILQSQHEEARLAKKYIYAPDYWIRENVFVTKETINQSVEFNFMDYTPLMFYVINGKQKEVEDLLSLGAGVNFRNEDNCTALIYGLKRNHLMIARTLLNDSRIKKSINAVTFKDKTTALEALIQLFYYGSFSPDDWRLFREVFRLMVERGADVNLAFCLHNISPLYECIKLLSIMKMEKYPKHEELDIETAVRYAARDDRVRRDSTEIFAKPLFSKYFDEQCAGSSIERSKEILTSNQDYIRAVIYEFLNVPGINVNRVEYREYTPLFLAAQLGETDICRELLEKGANPYYTITDHNILDIIFYHKQWDMVLLLLDYCDFEKLKEQSFHLIDGYGIMFLNYWESSDPETLSKIDQIVQMTIDFAMPILISSFFYGDLLKKSNNKKYIGTLEMYHSFLEEQPDNPLKDKLTSPENKLQFWEDIKQLHPIIKGGHNV